jgi:hypothetical protein
VDYYRERKTGPEFPIAVLACSTHDIGFTLYPSGHVPYGRERVVAVTPAGELVAPDAKSNGDKESAALEGTRFAGVADAAAGKLWPRAEPGTRRATQQTRIDDAAKLFTIHGGAAAVDAEVSRVIGVAHLRLRDSAELLAQTDDMVNQAKELMPLLCKSAEGARALERVLALGARAGLWGTVHFWRLSAGGLAPFRKLFPGSGTPSG